MESQVNEILAELDQLAELVKKAKELSAGIQKKVAVIYEPYLEEIDDYFTETNLYLSFGCVEYSTKKLDGAMSNIDYAKEYLADIIQHL